MGLIRTLINWHQLKRQEFLPPEELNKIQNERLRLLVRHAKQNSPFYRELYQGIDPDSPEFSVAALPVITKGMLMDRFDDVVTDKRLKYREVSKWATDLNQVGRLFKDEFIVSHTSGTTGEPAFFIYSLDEWDWIVALGWARSIRYRPVRALHWIRDIYRAIVPKIRWASLVATEGHFISRLLFQLFPRGFKLAVKVDLISVMEPIEEMVRKLNRFNPHILHAYPTLIEALAYEKLDGRLNINPVVITASSENFLPANRQLVKEAFPGVNIFETYGTTEAFPLASECRSHFGLHVNTDWFILEPVDEKNQPVPKGQKSYRLLATSLLAHTMPVIRYQVDDVVTIDDDPCPCGSKLPTITVMGRTDDSFWLPKPSGRMVRISPIPIEALCLSVGGIRQYQIVQEERELIRVLFVPTDTKRKSEVGKAFYQALSSLLTSRGVNETVEIKLEEVEQIERDPHSGKIRQIYSKVGAPF